MYMYVYIVNLPLPPKTPQNTTKAIVLGRAKYQKILASKERKKGWLMFQAMLSFKNRRQKNVQEKENRGKSTINPNAFTLCYRTSFEL